MHGIFLAFFRTVEESFRNLYLCTNLMSLLYAQDSCMDNVCTVVTLNWQVAGLLRVYLV